MPVGLDPSRQFDSLFRSQHQFYRGPGVERLREILSAEILSNLRSRVQPQDNPQCQSHGMADVRDGGRVAGRISGSYDLYLTQRLILQPQVELNFYSQADRGRGIGTGLSDLDSGVRLGYQISRKFAPYLGFTYSSSFGQTATFARGAGESVHISSLVFGVWIWR
jgi:uncharacterized protein involved in copper resistance